MGESRDEKSFKISLEFLFGLNAALFLTLLFVALFVFNDLDGDDASTAGGAFGTASAMFVIVVTIWPNGYSSATTAAKLLFWRAVCDCGVGLRFIIDDPHSNVCQLPAGILEFCVMASEAWFLCAACELVINSTPFSGSRDRMKLYHVFCWSFGILMAIPVMLEGQYGNWYLSSQVSFCWLNNSLSYSEDKWNYRTFVYVYVPITVMYLYAFRQLTISYFRLKNGISKTFKHRIGLLLHNAISVVVSVMYWAVLLTLYLSVYYFPGSTLSKLILFLLGAKGFPDFLVLFLVNRSNRASAADTSDIEAKLRGIDGSVPTPPEENVTGQNIEAALRDEVLRFATTGIRIVCSRCDMPLHNKSGNVEVYIFQNDSLNVWFFLRLIFGSRTILAMINVMVNSKASKNVAYTSVGGHSLEESKDGADETHQCGLPECLSQMNKDDMGSTTTPATPRESTAMEPSIVSFDVENMTVEMSHNKSESSSTTGQELESPAANNWPLLNALCSCCMPETTAPKPFITFTEYLPKHFRAIRKASNISNDFFRRAFAHTIKERLTQGGASGAFFFFSSGEDFVAKSCTEQEMTTLIGNVAKYASYLTSAAGASSFITRIYGAYRLNIYDTNLYFFVMNNLFLNAAKDVINEKYDLKGSWVKRNADLPMHGKSATCAYCNGNFTYLRANKRIKRGPKHSKFPSSNSLLPTSPETPVVNQMHAKTISESGTEDSYVDDDLSYRCRFSPKGLHVPSVILKDNDLKYKIRLPQELSKSVLEQLRLDAHFLESCGIMDYSLLLGVHYTSYDVDNHWDGPRQGGTGSISVSRPSSLKKITTAAEPDWAPPTDNVSSGAFFRPMRLQVQRVVGPKAYYIGIVDFQQEWDFGKKVERFFKINVLGEDPEGLSACEPIYYRERFERRLEELLSHDDADDYDRRASADNV